MANAALALSAVCRGNTANQSTVADLGGLPKLGMLLRPSTTSSLPVGKPAAFVEAEGAGALWALADGHEGNKISIAGAGAMPQLAGLLGSPNERAQSHAGSAMVSLAYKLPENQGLAAGLLVNLLLSSPEATQRRIVGILWQIIGDNVENESAIAKSGGAELLVALLRGTGRRQATEEAKAYALWSLSLCIDETNYAQIVGEGGVLPLVAALTGGDVDTMEQAARALSRLARYGAPIPKDNSDDPRLSIARAGGVEPLITLLEGTNAAASDESRLHAAATLSELAHLPANKLAIERCARALAPPWAPRSPCRAPARPGARRAETVRRSCGDRAEMCPCG